MKRPIVISESMKKTLSLFILPLCMVATSIAVPKQWIADERPLGKGEDGGVVPSEGREKVNAFFKNLKSTKTDAAEEKVLKDFADWLNATGYKIEVEVRGDVHRLACPYFPPVTPWMEYRFRSIENLKILPHRLRPLPD